jgi:hypothetical protein
MRTCRICGVEKHLETEFYFRKERGGYYRTECKECIRAKQREYNAAHPAPKRTEYHRAWRAIPENRERERARLLRHQRANRPRRREIARKSYLKNPEPHYRAMRVYRLRKRGAPMDAIARGWWEAIRYDPCSYCGSRERQSLDHIDALARAGNSGWTNLTPACASCNASKQDRSLLEFLLHRTEVV